jgi:4'-phosphopantetheinyl transferase
VSAAAPVHCLIRHAADVAPGEAWLSPAERGVAAGFRIDKRRNDWRLGRWTAKSLVATRLGMDLGLESLARIEIRAAADGAPEPVHDEFPLELALSISHSAGLAASAAAPAGVAFGCDLELIRALRSATVAHFFTACEQAMLAGLEPHDWAVRGTLIWTAKEAALKALRVGLRLDTRSVEAVPSFEGEPAAWRGLTVTHLPDGRAFGGWWRRLGDHVLSIVAEPAASVPVMYETLARNAP